MRPNKTMGVSKGLINIFVVVTESPVSRKSLFPDCDELCSIEPVVTPSKMTTTTTGYFWTMRL